MRKCGNRKNRQKRKKWLDRRARRLCVLKAWRKRLRRMKRSRTGMAGRRSDVNRKQIVQCNPKKHAKVSFPKELSVKTKFDDLVGFLGRLKQAFFEDRAGTVEIDHSEIERLTPGGILVLLAEFSRITSYTRGAILRGRFSGVKPEVMELLGKSGYLDNFPRIRRGGESGDRRIFVSAKSGTETDGAAAAALTGLFRENEFISEHGEKQLGRALIECMQNVGHHAYPDRKDENWLRKRWWMLGYADPGNDEIYFAFYDQGVGMPVTLRFRAKDKIFSGRFIGKTDEDLIVKAFEGAFSSTKLENRGLGLPTLKKMVDEAPDGELFVQSRKSRVVLSPNQAPVGQAMEKELAGTLLVWHLRRGTEER